MTRVLLLSFIAACFISGASAQGYVTASGEVKPVGSITFATGTATIDPSSEEGLLGIKKFLDEKSYVTLLRVEGHVFGAAKPQALSEARANAICAWLVAKGVDCKRLLPVGFGDTKPISSDEPASNTRITFVNAALRGHAIGGMPVDGGGNVAGDPCK
jgi:OOP family OmpA-OmpF porin